MKERLVEIVSKFDRSTIIEHQVLLEQRDHSVALSLEEMNCLDIRSHEPRHEGAVRRRPTMTASSRRSGYDGIVSL